VPALAPPEASTPGCRPPPGDAAPGAHRARGRPPAAGPGLAGAGSRAAGRPRTPRAAARWSPGAPASGAPRCRAGGPPGWGAHRVPAVPGGDLLPPHPPRPGRCGAPGARPGARPAPAPGGSGGAPALPASRARPAPPAAPHRRAPGGSHRRRASRHRETGREAPPSGRSPGRRGRERPAPPRAALRGRAGGRARSRPPGHRPAPCAGGVPPPGGGVAPARGRPGVPGRLTGQGAARSAAAVRQARRVGCHRRRTTARLVRSYRHRPDRQRARGPRTRHRSGGRPAAHTDLGGTASGRALPWRSCAASAWGRRQGRSAVRSVARASASSWHCRVRVRAGRRPRRWSLASAGPRRASKGIAHPPAPHEAGTRRCGHGTGRAGVWRPPLAASSTPAVLGGRDAQEAPRAPESHPRPRRSPCPQPPAAPHPTPPPDGAVSAQRPSASRGTAARRPTPPRPSSRLVMLGGFRQPSGPRSPGAGAASTRCWGTASG